MKQLQISKSNVIKMAIAILLMLFLTINIDYSYNHRTYNFSPFKNQPKVELTKQDENFKYYKITNTCSNRQDYDYARSVNTNISYFTKFDYGSILMLDENSLSKDTISVGIKINSRVRLYFKCNSFDLPINVYNFNNN
jgi:hypothetical protein